MIHAKNYDTVSKFVKVMTKILWPLFSRTRCTTACCYRTSCDMRHRFIHVCMHMPL